MVFFCFSVYSLLLLPPTQVISPLKMTLKQLQHHYYKKCLKMMKILQKHRACHDVVYFHHALKKSIKNFYSITKSTNNEKVDAFTFWHTRNHAKKKVELTSKNKLKICLLNISIQINTFMKKWFFCFCT